MQMFLLGVIVTLTPSILTLAWLLWRVEGAQELRFDPERKYSRALYPNSETLTHAAHFWRE
jgi:hypothetical protein